MRSEELFVKALNARDNAKAADKAQVTTGSVRDVDLVAYTCTVDRMDRPTVFNVRLNACEYSGNRVAAIPSVGSTVLICTIEGHAADAYLLACSDIDQVLIETGSTSFKISQSGTLIKKDADTLEKVLSDLVDQVIKIYAPKDVPGLGAIKKRISNLLN